MIITSIIVMMDAKIDRPKTYIYVLGLILTSIIVMMDALAGTKILFPPAKG